MCVHVHNTVVLAFLFQNFLSKSEPTTTQNKKDAKFNTKLAKSGHTTNIFH